MTRVLILGTGGMANTHAEAYAKIEGVEIVAGVDTRPENLAAFQDRHGIKHGFATLEEAIAWGEFEAVSNVTPDPVHHKTTLALCAAGKHVLCEKPLAVNAQDAAEMVEAAEKAGVVNMVNLSYRQVPALIRAHEMVAAGQIGEIRHFEAAYLQSWLTQDAWGKWDEEDQWLWRLSTAHGSKGVLGDIGVHILDFATYAADRLAVADVSCRLVTFDKAPGGKIGAYKLDANDSFVMHVGMENGAIGVIHASRFASGHLNDLTLRIHGTKGALEVRHVKGGSELRACLEPDLKTATWQDVDCPAVPSNYWRFIDAVRRGVPVRPDFRRGAVLQQVLDRAEESHAAGGASLAIAG